MADAFSTFHYPAGTVPFLTAEKAKLSGIAVNANNYSHPANHPPSIITQDASNRFVSDTEKATWNAKQPAGSYEPAYSVGTTAQYWRGDKSWQALNATAVGLGSVNNTADAAKNVLSATKLTTARTINGVSFDGSANITVADSTKAPLTGAGTSGTWGISITGNAASVTTNANLTGDVTSVGNATTLQNAPVIAKVLTGFVSGAGTVAATDSILSAIQKLNGNVALAAPLTHVGTGGTAHAVVVASGAAGFMSGADKAKLDSYAAGAALSGSNTGDQTITLTGAVTGSGTGSFVTTLANSVVGLANMANVATGTVFYRKAGGTGAPEVQTLATLKADLNIAPAAGMVKSNGTVLSVAVDGTDYLSPTTGLAAGAHPPTIITQDASNRFVTDTEKAAWNNAIGEAPADSKTYGRKNASWTEVVTAIALADIPQEGADDGDSLVWNGTTWEPAPGGSVHVISDIEPADPQPKQKWTDTTSGITYTWYVDEDSAAWVEFGASGIVGASGMILVGEVNFLPSGSTLSIENVGSANAAVLNFNIPAGDKGDIGPGGTVEIGTVTALSSGSSPTVVNVGSPEEAVLNFGIPTPFQIPAIISQNNATTTTETVVASFLLPANTLELDAYFKLAFMGQTSSTGGLTFRARIGSSGTTSDALAGQFATTTGGASNSHVVGDVHLHMVTTTTMYAGGYVQAVNSGFGKATGAFSAATVTPSIPLYLSLTLQQSSSQTFTSRSAVLTRLR